MIAPQATAALPDSREPLPRDLYFEMLAAYLGKVETSARELAVWEATYDIHRDPRSVQIQIDWLRQTLAHVAHFRALYRLEEGGRP